jgi:hypothetical protein
MTELKHAEIICHMAKHGFDSVEYLSPSCGEFFAATQDTNPTTNPQFEWYIKPKKRLIDWSKMPRGTMTNCGEFLGFSSPHPISRKIYPQCLRASFDSSSYNMEQLRLAEQTQFTYWGGGECPVPEGVVVEAILRDGDKYKNPTSWRHAIINDEPHCGDVIAYRIIGLASDYTDNPSEAL